MTQAPIAPLASSQFTSWTWMTWIQPSESTSLLIQRDSIALRQSPLWLWRFRQGKLFWVVNSKRSALSLFWLIVFGTGSCRTIAVSRRVLGLWALLTWDHRTVWRHRIRFRLCAREPTFSCIMARLTQNRWLRLLCTSTTCR